MTTAASISVEDAFGNVVHMHRTSNGYPDTQFGVLETLRLAVPEGEWTRPASFSAWDFRARVIQAWREAGIDVSAVSRDAQRPASFHYTILPSRGADGCVYVRVAALEEHPGGVGPQSFVPVHAFLVFPERVRATDTPLSRDAASEAAGRSVYPALKARIMEAVESNPPMLGHQRDWLTAGMSTISLAGWLKGGERADPDVVLALEKRGQRALRRVGR